MSQKSVPKFHHYIPKFQLNYFVNSENKVHLYDRVTKTYREQTTARVGGITNYYTYINDSGEKITELEELNSQIEGAAGIIIKKLHNREKVDLDGQEKADLALFLALGWLRTPSAQANTEMHMEAVTKTMLRLNAIDEESFNKMLDNYEQKSGNKIDDRQDYREFVLQEKYRIRYNRLASLQMMISKLTPITKALQSMRWVVCTATQRKFILSDVNFIVEQIAPSPDPMRGGGGLLTPGNQSMSVLTPKIGIILSPKSGYTQYADVGSKFVDSSNVIYARKSRRLVVAHSKATLRRIVSRANLATSPIPRHELEIVSGPEGKTYRYISD